MYDFDRLIGDLDLGLYSAIASQSTDEDKRSWLACQLAVRELRGEYRYLEIGSYLGGSLQPYLLDDRCVAVYSIDKRPQAQPDERGVEFVYDNNSTERMLAGLARFAADKLHKLTTIDGDTRELDAASLSDKVDFCLIDGEHTDAAVVSDFKFCMEALGESGAIMFDDAQITYNGLQDCVDHLQQHSIEFNAYVLPHKIFVIEIGDFPIHCHPKIQERLLGNHKAYLFSLRDNDHYRRFANRGPFKMLRSFLAKVRRSNVSY